jgi:two-component system, cell cycle sensor histidine kinase DivJ
LLPVLRPILQSLTHALSQLPAAWSRPGDVARVDNPTSDACLAARIEPLAPGLVALLDSKCTVKTIGGLDAPGLLKRMGVQERSGFLDQLHVLDRLTLLQALDRLRQDSDREIIDLRFVTPIDRNGGAAVVLKADLKAIRDDEGRLCDVLMHCADQTDMVVLRQQLQEAEARADEMEGEKTRFLAAVSHEMRTPLNAIIGFSEILNQGYFGVLENERQRDYVELIHSSGRHLLSVVNTMLDMSKIEAGRYQLIAEPFAVEDAVSSNARMLTLEAERKGLSLTTRVAKSCGQLAADRRAIDQILINLVANAIKFTDKGGVVSIDAERIGETMRLRVSDTGIGIAAETLARLGRPFVQANSDLARKYEGTGLGLCLVKGLVALHGGTLTITSDPGNGTAVTIDLPADGSGIHDVPDAVAPDNMIEFPPRLKTMENGAFDGRETHGTTAKTA